MRNLFVLSALFASIMLLGSCDSGGKPGETVKIAVADVSRLMRDSVPGKAGIKFLESRQSNFQKELDDIQDRLEKNPSDEAAMKDLQRVYSASQQQIQAEGQNVAALLFDTLQRILDQFREKNGYTLILGQDTVASFAKSVDVTDAVMKELDKETIEFKPLPPPAPIGLDLPEAAKPDKTTAPDADKSAVQDKQDDKKADDPAKKEKTQEDAKK